MHSKVLVNRVSNVVLTLGRLPGTEKIKCVSGTRCLKKKPTTYIRTQTEYRGLCLSDNATRSIYPLSQFENQACVPCNIGISGGNSLANVAFIFFPSSYLLDSRHPRQVHVCKQLFPWFAARLEMEPVFCG